GGRGLAQASPIAAGPLLCTHNGHLDPASITSHRNLSDDELPPDSTATDSGWTDSHKLFSAIATAHARRRGLTDTLVNVLSSVHGQAALAWTDTSRPDHRVWLVRGGLSPLAVG